MNHKEEQELQKVASKTTRSSDVFADLLQKRSRQKYDSRLATSYDGVDEDIKKELAQGNTGTLGILNKDTNKSKENSSKLATHVPKDETTSKQQIKHNSRNQTKVTASDNLSGTGKVREKRKVDRIATRVKKTNQRARDVLHARELLEKQEDGGVDYIQNTSKYASKKAGRKVLRKVKNKTITPLAEKGSSALGHAFGKVLLKVKKYLPILGGGYLAIVIPLCLLLVVVMSVSSVFGGGSSNRAISNYESSMTYYQEMYDAKVDEWEKNNPDGIVYGVRGDYGSIEWRAPLTIIQSLSSKLKGDVNEMSLLRSFHEAGLFEVHIEGEKEEKYATAKKDDNGHIIYETKVIKTLTIVNPSLEDYKDWCKDNFPIIKGFLDTKKIKYKDTYSYFTKQELQRMYNLYSSEDFFYMFSEKFQDFVVKKGNNGSTAGVDSAHYQANNPYTSSGLRGQCTWYVWGRASEVLGIKLPSKMGNAQNWINSAIANGYKTGSKPSKNSIMVLSGGDFGHVAYVEGWDGKTITFSEGNYGNPHANDSNMVSYANKHYKELLNTTKKEYEIYKVGNSYSIHGLTVVGYIYLE